MCLGVWPSLLTHRAASPVELPPPLPLTVAPFAPRRRLAGVGWSLTPSNPGTRAGFSGQGSAALEILTRSVLACGCAPRAACGFALDPAGPCARTGLPRPTDTAEQTRQPTRARSARKMMRRRPSAVTFCFKQSRSLPSPPSKLLSIKEPIGNLLGTFYLQVLTLSHFYTIIASYRYERLFDSSPGSGGGNRPQGSTE